MGEVTLKKWEKSKWHSDVSLGPWLFNEEKTRRYSRLHDLTVTTFYGAATDAYNKWRFDGYERRS